MNELQKKVSEIGVVPVIKLNNPTRDAKPLADALCAGGVPVAEVTFRAAGAADAGVVKTIVKDSNFLHSDASTSSLEVVFSFRDLFCMHKKQIL